MAFGKAFGTLDIGWLQCSKPLVLLSAVDLEERLGSMRTTDSTDDDGATSRRDIYIIGIARLSGSAGLLFRVFRSSEYV